MKPTKEEIKTEKTWEESLNIKQRFPWANEEQQKHIMAEIKFQRQQSTKDLSKTIEEIIEVLVLLEKNQNDIINFICGKDCPLTNRKQKNILKKGRKV